MTIHTSPASTIRSLTLADIDRMRLRLDADFDVCAIERVVTGYPGRSLWDSRNLEVIVVGPWRHRHDVASVVGMKSVRAARQLVLEAMRRTERFGAEAFLMLEWEERRNPAFYEALGLDLLDSVIPYERQLTSSDFPGYGSYLDDLVSLSAEDIPELIGVDNSAFPWLWINNREEFIDYLDNEAVRIVGHRIDGRLVSYLGFTSFGQWGHIDRIAVRPEMQRRGLGKRLMFAAFELLRQYGATTVGLSTQKSNWKSQRLYQQLGFRRTRQNSYRVYGTRL